MSAPSWRRLAHRITLAVSLALAAGASAAAQGAPAAANANATDKKAKKAKAPKDPALKGAKAAEGPSTIERGLFSSDTLLHVTLVGDFRRLAGERDTLHPRTYRGTLRVARDDSAGTRDLPIQLSARGHFRLQARTCEFPPLRVVLDSGAGHTPFRSQRSLKLVTHCRGTRDGEQLLLREYLTYRSHNLITPASFRARLVRVRYVESRDTTRSQERLGFFLESERELARRLGGQVLEAKGAVWSDITPDSGVAMSMWEYFIGNTDWSLAYLHNVRLVTKASGEVMAVPYDFDFSGLVDSWYSMPDPRLPIRSVHERLWRGPCADAKSVETALQPFREQKEAMFAVWRGLPMLERSNADKALKYLEQFYEDTRDPTRFARGAVRVRCAPGA